jgi:hypothetical protein
LSDEYEEGNMSKNSNNPRILEIAGFIVALIAALAAVSEALFGPGIWSWLSKTPTPEIASPTPKATETTSLNETYLFFEDFQDNQHSFYSLDIGIWTIQDDSSQPGNKVFQVSPTGVTDPAVAVLLPEISGPFTIEFRTRFTQSNPERCFVSIMWLSNHNFVISPAQGNIYVANRDTGERFFEDYSVIEVNVWYTLRVAVNENNATFFINGRGVGSAENIPTGLPHRLYFVVGEKSGIVQFDDFLVTKTGQ